MKPAGLVGNYCVKKLTSNNCMRNPSKPFVILVEGNIGSGKTTFLNYFKKYDDVCLQAEPIEMWRNCNGHNLLQLMYENPHKWSPCFQSYVQLSMLQQHTRATNHTIKMMERSIYSARYCFVEKMSRTGLLTPPAVSVLDEWFKWVVKSQDVSVDLIVYLRTTPEVVYERMQQRNRQEEKTVSLQYLQELHEIHEDWLYHKTLHHCPAPVLVMDANLDIASIQREYEKCESQILGENGLIVN